ncbi:hypothetical protein Pcinc_020404 [Petrolisthes cinctipes]|uniref:Uncharacterized protein n=1 Tax=Petrolisthes cinctipes TaxID=88211 RepID=A0AAE1KJT9_PETCI|nr:hypothetical protein Pcinc_020404 [Petrolisthes cinctipes]
MTVVTKYEDGLCLSLLGNLFHAWHRVGRLDDTTYFLQVVGCDSTWRCKQHQQQQHSQHQSSQHRESNMTSNEKIGIVGSGFIGRSWAMLFASVGYDVCMYDVQEKQVSDALQEIHRQLTNLETTGLLKGKLTAAEQKKCIRGVTSLKECVQGAKHVQESVFEDLEVKKKVLTEIDQLVGPETVVASSSSCIPPSKLSADLAHKANVILAHPYNPPYYVPAVEVVPAPWTSQDVVARTRAILTEIGQVPVVLTREHPGFASCRIQYAILNECVNLVKSGVISVQDVEALMKHGLGYRYAWMGPLETAVLNANVLYINTTEE